MSPNRLVVAILMVWPMAILIAAADDKEDPNLKLTKEEQQIFELCNAARKKEKLEPLKVNALLVKAARAHSANMAKQKKPDQHMLDGKMATDRIEAVGYNWAACDENLATLWLEPPNKKYELATLFAGWMKSKSHRPNILGDTEETGVGIVFGKVPTPRGDRQGMYITQVFGTQQKKK